MLSAARGDIGLQDPFFPKKSLVPVSFPPQNLRMAVKLLSCPPCPHQYHTDMLCVDLALPACFPQGEKHGMTTLTKVFYGVLKQTFFSCLLEGKLISIFRCL